MQIDGRLRALHPGDDVAVVVSALDEGDRLSFGRRTVVTARRMHLGDKVALHAIRPGDAVRKFGEVIGTATRNVSLGDWVHVHNLRSNYIDGVVNDEPPIERTAS